MDSRDSPPSQFSDKNSCRNSASDSWSVVTASNTVLGYLHEPMQGYRPRRRRPFEPHEREEVAAVRRVGACASCHKRKVKCTHVLSSQSALSLQTLRSGRDSECTENSNIPSLSNSMPSAASSGGRTTQSRRPSGDGKTLDDSVMLERFLGSEGGVRWLDGVEAKMGYEFTDSKDLKSMFGSKDPGLEQFSDLLYPTTIDFSDDIVVFPARRPVPDGENIPWDLHTGREATQPLRPHCRGVQKRRNNNGHRRTSTGYSRLSSDPRLLDAVGESTGRLDMVGETSWPIDVIGETAHDFSRMGLNSGPPSISDQIPSESYDDTWGQSSQYTILPPSEHAAGHSMQYSTAVPISSHLQQDHVPATSSYTNLQPPWHPRSNSLFPTPSIFNVESAEMSSMDVDRHRAASLEGSMHTPASDSRRPASFQGSLHTPASDNLSNSFGSSHLTPMRYSQSFSHQRSAYLPLESPSPHTPLQDMSRQPSLGWESASSRDGTWPLSPQLSRSYTRPLLFDSNQTTPSPLRQAHDQMTQVIDIPPLAYPSDLIVEYAEGPPIKAPIDSYEFTAEEIDEQLREWEIRNCAG